MNGVQIRIRGKVQGVGFRPFVWQLARAQARCGDVCNDGDGVLVRLVGGDDGFTAALADHCPPLARIDSTACIPYRWAATPQDFTIRESGAGRMRTQIVPDAATCPACLAEMNDPRARRYRYPFINCTHCGPRLTIIRAMPYDRPFTAMAPFPLCSPCEAEFRDPADRRFHAQPVACPECGPHLEWVSHGEHAEQEAALQAAIAQLKMGKIVAIKGIGGFHLACDARNSNAVATLRARKHRPAKPLAVMLPNSDALPIDARSLLNTPAAPIVLVDKKYVPELCDDIAPGLNEVGVMLPANPLQHLLLQELQCPLVMTSGNLSGRPPAISNQQALDELGVCFLFAPKYHTGFRHAMPVRQQLKTRTLFNVLGPLINPAHPPLALIGVYSPELVLPIAETLRVLGYQRAAVVHSGGMDEVSLHAPTVVAELHNGEIKSYQLTADDFGLTPYHQAQLAGGTPEENRDILTRLLQGKGEAAHEAAVAANVAMLMRLHGHEDLKANAQQVLDVLHSGAAYDRVTALAARG